jgi:hypothetical protein
MYRSIIIYIMPQVRVGTGPVPDRTGWKRKQEFRRTDFGSRLLAAEGEGGGRQ